jgi:hypothetical protein
VLAVRASGRSARVEIAAPRAPDAARVLADLAALEGARIVESLPLDMEAVLLAQARGASAQRAEGARSPIGAPRGHAA